MESDLEHLGAAIRARRTSLGMRLSDLGLAAELTRGYISQIENGTSIPSLYALAKIAAALEVELSALLDSNPPPSATVTRLGKEQVLRVLGDSTYRAHGLPERVWPFPVLTHDFRVDDEPRQCTGEQFIIVLSGSLKLTIGPDNYHLGTGSTAHFRVGQDNTLSSESDERTRALIVTVQDGR